MKAITAIMVFAASLLASHLCPAQERAALSFGETAWDFGSIREADGPVTHIFRFSNTSGAPIVLERVQSDCGCTTPHYSREPVRPGMEGTIEVTFDPANFKGRITKAVSVFCNNGKSRNMLTIKADVVAKPRSQEETYPLTLAPGVRADRLNVPFAYIENGSVNSMTVELVNTTKKEITITADEVTGDGRLIAALPGSIQPGSTASITLTYDLRRAKPVYGVISDRVYLSVDGRRCELPVTTSAIAVDDFSRQDHARAAGCSIAPAFHNFGTVKQGQALGSDITISNTGKSPLIVRNVSARRGAATSLKAGTVIAPGQSKVFTVSLDTADGYGFKTGGISIIVNEPEHPMREIRLAAEITD